MFLTLSTLFSSMTRMVLKGWREVPSRVPPRVRMPEKSSGFISLYSPKINPL